MAEYHSVLDGGVLKETERQRDDEQRMCPVNSFPAMARRPLSDSSIKYEENAFHDSSEVILVNYSERRNSVTPGSSDGDISDDVDVDDGRSRSSMTSSVEPKRSVHVRSRKTAKSGFACGCEQSQKAKRKAASKLASVSSAGFAVQLPSSGGEAESLGTRRKDTSLMNRVRKWFQDSGSPINSDSNEPKWPKSVGSTSKGKAADVTPLSRTAKKELQKKERHYIIADILAVTNCCYYWGNINRHEAEELLAGRPDGTFLLRDSAHKEHLFSVSFRRYNKTLHARIEQWDHKYSFDRESPTAYYSLTIEGLLSHYSVGEYCMFFEPMLVKPLYRTQPQPLMSLCRGAIGSCTNYEDVDGLPIPTSLKTFLKEYNYCIKPKSKKDDIDGRRKRNSTLCIF